MLKAVIDTSFVYKNKTGIGAYVDLISNALVNLGIEVRSIECKSLYNLPLKSYPYQIWLNTVFHRYVKREKPDVVFSPSFMMPICKRRGTAYLTSILDLSPYLSSNMHMALVVIFKWAIYIAVKRADFILTISETVKKELVEKFNLSSERIKLIYCTYNSLYLSDLNDPNVLEKYALQKNNYILSVATLNKRKNIPALVKAFESISQDYPDLKLVLVGGMGNEARKELTANENVIFTGYVADEELPTLYKNALMYVFPSIYEGFGIPILEAQASKTPVICSDIPVFREVGADSVLYCEPTPEGLSEKIEELINKPKLQKELRSKGIENIKRFSSEVIQDQIKGVLTELGAFEE